MIFLYGAYGTGNLGDDLILRSVLDLYKDRPTTVVAYGAPKLEERIQFILHHEFVRSTREYVSPGDELVFAGGGLFWADVHIGEMCTCAEEVLKAGGTVRMERAGAQGVEIDPQLSKRLLSLCSRVTVRDRESVEIVNRLDPKIKCEYERDFVFELKSEFSPLRRESKLVIGLSHSAQSFFHDAKHREKTIELYSRVAKASQSFAEFVYVPHVRHYNVISENDVIFGEYFWQGSGGLIRSLPMPENIIELVNIYRGLDGLVAWRYHALVLAVRAGIPTAYVGDIGENKYTALANEYNLRKIDFSQSVDALAGAVWSHLQHISVDRFERAVTWRQLTRDLTSQSWSQVSARG